MQSTGNVHAAPISAAPVSVWEVSVTPPVMGGMAWRASLVDKTEPLLLRDLKANPTATVLSWDISLLKVTARLGSGRYVPGARVRLVFAEPTPTASTGTGDKTALPWTPLPDDGIAALGDTLVGLESISRPVMTDLALRCAPGPFASTAPAAYTDYLARNASVYCFLGDPATGKTVLASTITDAYCRANNLSGRLIKVGTEVRGDGTVGNLSAKVHQAFRALWATPTSEAAFLLFDEAEAIFPARSSKHMHHEDVAGTASALQCLDAMPKGRALGVFMTANRKEAVDAAILRRAQVFHFPRPDRAARRAIIARWLPDFAERALDEFAALTRGLTAADIERALAVVVSTTILQGTAPSVAGVRLALRRAERTGSV